MTLNRILDEAKTLSQPELKELAKLLIDMLAVAPPVEEAEPEEHWGKNLLRLLDEIGPIELIYPEIEDPVEWVKQIRKDQQQRRLGDWGHNE